MAARSIEAIRLYRHIARQSLKMPPPDRSYYRNFASSVCVPLYFQVSDFKHKKIINCEI